MNFHPETRRRSMLRKGFTLLELIVVITIIGILGTMVVVKVGGWTSKAKEAKIKNDLKSIIDAAEMWQAATGRYPESLEELKGGKTIDGEDTGIKVENTKDPWSNEYLYELSTDGSPRVRCLGADGMEGGDGDNKDYEMPQVEMGDLGY